MAQASDFEGSSSVPLPGSTMIGRNQELIELRQLLVRADVALVTLTGAGGVGKTRLALAVAAAADAEFRDGVVVVNLAALNDPALVLPTIAHAVGARDAGDRLVAARIADPLSDRAVLMVLDNLEHVADAAPQLAALLTDCPRLTILVTSRVVLHLSGEHVFPVLPLKLPSVAGDASIDVTASVGAVALFEERTRAADPSFALTEGNAAVVADIVRRLDGLPLAIELAAARSRTLSPSALLALLSDPLRVLTGGARDMPERQRTMRATIAWSYDLLTEDEQMLICRLSVFVGGVTLKAAEAVASIGDVRTTCPGGDTGTAVVDLIGSLVDQSLLTPRVDPYGQPRFMMLETVREFAFDRLIAAGGAELAELALAAFLLKSIGDATPTPMWPPTDTLVRLLDVERDNIRVALRRLASVGDRRRLLRLTTWLWTIW